MSIYEGYWQNQKTRSGPKWLYCDLLLEMADEGDLILLFILF